MKEIYTALYPNEQVATNVGDYSFSHSTKLPKHITDHHAWGVETQERSNYMISPLQAQFQVWLAKAVGAKRVLEIGTFIGFSTMGWSEAVSTNGHVTALEFSPEYAQIAEEAFAKNSITNIEVIVGDARESIKKLSTTIPQPYDLIFIDADKTSYPTYLSQILEYSPPNSTSVRLLRQGGIIVADNILRRGLVADPSDANPQAAKERERTWRADDMDALHKFNDMMVESARLETFLMPMFDGLGCGRLVD
ncbi:O-methyltransferase-like protein [Mollisia scopiformis]|uniref:O-methyltransferas-like protein n=1 Tax=Mollisia scopiformis TaxID=149040 RepID=A0A132BA24_MOLSC|nr:O-methyltransferase-like protein [Mollisia scopiformis]KUJ09255.1 O-methyltransferas-like protein [Mollisia scopiformis]